LEPTSHSFSEDKGGVTPVDDVTSTVLTEGHLNRCPSISTMDEKWHELRNVSMKTDASLSVMRLLR
jgi:hypothetical protein